MAPPSRFAVFEKKRDPLTTMPLVSVVNTQLPAQAAFC
jgi:hypothetical protein